MQELRFVAVSEDGRYAVLAVPGRSARFTLPIDERLRAVALGQSSRLVQYEIEVESPLRPKEIQARIRAGETVEEIADAAGIAAERVRWFEGPVLAERAYVADQAQKAPVRRQGEPAPSTPGPALGEIVAERLKAVGSDPEDAQWDAKKRGDNSWQVQLTFISGGRPHTAEWAFDQRRRHVLPADDNAARMSLPGGEPPQPAAVPPGQATVTQLAPRLSTASGQLGQSGTGTAGLPPAGLGNGGPGRARHERPGPPRPPTTEPASPAPAAPAVAGSEDDDRRPSRPPAARHAPPAARPSQDPAAEPATASPPVTPAPVAAQVIRAPQPRPQEPRPEPAVPAAPALARGEQPGPAGSAGPGEPDGEQAGRQSRKMPRGKRASVPSWDEIMFGNARQRD